MKPAASTSYYTAESVYKVFGFERVDRCFCKQRKIARCYRYLLLRDIPIKHLAVEDFEYIVNALLNAKPQGDC